MVHKIACQISGYCLDHSWIREQDIKWCIYAFEKKLSSAFFLLFVGIIALLANKWLELCSFLIPFYLLRRRIGGWHCRTALLCLFSSLGIICYVLFVWSTLLNIIHPLLLYSIDILALIFLFFSHPSYPPQLHFNSAVVILNDRRKKAVIILIAIIQTLSVLFLNSVFIEYSIPALLVCILLITIQHHLNNQKGGTKNNGV